jgi:hypothetical protein
LAYQKQGCSQHAYRANGPEWELMPPFVLKHDVIPVLAYGGFSQVSWYDTPSPQGAQMGVFQFWGNRATAFEFAATQSLLLEETPKYARKQ